MTATGTERRATDREIATARAWVDHIHCTPKRSIQHPDEAWEAYCEAEEAEAEYEHALAVLVFAADWKPTATFVEQLDRLCGCMAHWAATEPGWSRVRAQCYGLAVATHDADPKLRVCANCASCNPGGI